MPSDQILAIYRGPHGALIDDGVTFPAHTEVLADREHVMHMVQLGAQIDIREPEASDVVAPVVSPPVVEANADADKPKRDKDADLAPAE